MMGYTNVNKGMRRIIDLEREGVVYPEVLEKIIDALELDRNMIDRCIKEDNEQKQREFEEWLSEPIKPYYVLRIIPAIYNSYNLPGNLSTEEEAAEYVADIARKKQKIALLCLSRREKISISEKGEVMGKIKTTIENAHYPYTRIK